MSSMQEIYGRLAAVADNLRGQVGGPLSACANELQEAIGKITSVRDKLEEVVSKATAANDYAEASVNELHAVNDGEESQVLSDCTSQVAHVMEEVALLRSACSMNSHAIGSYNEQMQSCVDLIDDVVNRIGNTSDVIEQWRVH